MKIRLITIINIVFSYLYGQSIMNFVLCEGNFGSANASLWSFDQQSSSNTPIFWDENSNPLGDVGQSMTIHNGKIYIVMNNSHTIEIMDLEDGINYSATINLPNASPRYMYAENNLAYVSSWGLNAILIIDLDENEVTDTISISGMPEHIINYHDHLYVSIPSNSDWSTNNQIVKISKDNLAIDTVYIVEPGPSMMVLNDTSLFVSSTSYDDAWNTYAGISKINLHSNEITRYNAGISTNYGTDIINYQNRIYQVFNGGLVPLNDDLSPNINEKIGDLESIYSAATDGNYLYFGKSDYVAPDTILILDENGELVYDFVVGALPGSFAFYDQNLSLIDNDLILPNNITLMNFPNPFNPKTTIQYSLVTKGAHRVYITNIIGNIVEEFQVDDFIVGERKISWNASSLSSGIYFAIIEQGNKSKAIKLSLIK